MTQRCFLVQILHFFASSESYASEERWLMAWAVMGLCCCSSRDFLAAKAQEQQVKRRKSLKQSGGCLGFKMV